MTSETENQYTEPYAAMDSLSSVAGQAGATQPAKATPIPAATAYAPAAPELDWLFACQKYQARKMAMREQKQILEPEYA